jgi:hypothetical protein
MSKVKRLKRKRALQKKANIRQMAFQKKWGACSKPRRSLKDMTGNYLDVLQNIEFILLSEYENDASIDDCVVADALRAAVLNTEPDDDTAQFLKERLEQIRELRSDTSDDIWRDGLRTVLQSVLRHSSLKPGCRWYLDFVYDLVSFDTVEGIEF